jgi:YHS domain-containing protein
MKLSIALVMAFALSLSAVYASPGCGATCSKPGKTVCATDKAATGAAVKSDASYPIDYCVVSGEKLSSMGEPVVKTYNGREVRFCCNSCVAKFEKDEAKYSKKLDDAIIAAQKPSYAPTTCPVTGEKLVGGDMGGPVDYVYNNQLVRFCCKGCIATFKKNPEKYLSKLKGTAAPESKDSGTSEVQH